jgi:hypothetical protein
VKSAHRTSAVLLAAWLIGVGVAGAQDATADSATRPDPVDVVRLFDAYAIAKAQDMIGLDEGQYSQFVSRFRLLQDARRRHLHARRRIVTDLARLSNDETAADEDLRARIRALGDEDMRAREETARLQQDVDELLTDRQRASFRVFEDHLERRKFELIMRARQTARGSRRALRTTR